MSRGVATQLGTRVEGGGAVFAGVDLRRFRGLWNALRSFFVISNFGLFLLDDFVDFLCRCRGYLRNGCVLTG